MRRTHKRPVQYWLARRRHERPLRCRVVFAVVVGLLEPAAVWAQVLPAEPFALAGGRLVVSGEVTATVAPEDTGYFNYTDYEQSALRQVRAGLTTSLSLGRKAMVLGEVRSETGNTFDIYAMFLRLRPWEGRMIDLQLGRIPPSFGAFSRRGYGLNNPLIGYPLQYHYLTSLRADAIPANADDLLRMRGRGWRPAFPIGDQTAGPGLPLMSALRWDTGVQVRVGNRPVQVVAAVTNGSLSNPLVKDDNGGKQIAGRVVYQPSAGLVLGVSGGRAAYLGRAATDLLAVGSDGNFTQNAVGVDIEYSREHWVVRAESVLSQWTLPTVNAPFLDSPLAAVGLFVEGQYKLRPGLYVAGRADHLGFSDVTGTLKGGASDPLGLSGDSARGWRWLLPASEHGGEGGLSAELARESVRTSHAIYRRPGDLLVLMPPRRAPASLLVGFALIVTLGSTVTAQTGAIRGHVALPREIAAVARRPDVSGLGMPSPRNTTARRQSVVYLEVAPREAFEGASGSRATIDQRSETFVPHIVAVEAGTDVDFPNNDETYHNVFSLSPVGAFDLGRYAAGRSKSVRFDRPGIVRVFCDIHSHMSAFVLVFGHRFYAVTGDDGNYRIDDVPPGRYTVTAWHERFGTVSQSVQVPEDGGDVDLAFSFPAR